jgi:hypothetical protein
MDSDQILNIILEDIRSVKEDVKQVKIEQKEIASSISQVHQALDNKFEKLSGRISAWLAIGATFFIFVISGSFMFTSRVEDRVKEIENKAPSIESLMRDVGQIDGALKLRFPDSAVFGTAYERYIKYRGSTQGEEE